MGDAISQWDHWNSDKSPPYPIQCPPQEIPNFFPNSVTLRIPKPLDAKFSHENHTVLVHRIEQQEPSQWPGPKTTLESLGGNSKQGPTGPQRQPNTMATGSPKTSQPPEGALSWKPDGEDTSSRYSGVCSFLLEPHTRPTLG